MILERLDLKAFGRFSDVSLDLSAGPHRFHLIYGPNESGKSTTLRAITSLFFGMEHRTTDNYLHSNAQMRVGGVMSDGQSSLECFRRRGRKGTLRSASDNEPIDESVLSKMLGGIDRETFLTRFGLSHEELLRGGSAMLAGEGDLGEILFAAGAGVSHLSETLEKLESDRDALFVPRGNRTINSAIKEIENQRRELRQAQTQPTEFLELTKKLNTQKQQADQLEKSVTETTNELARWRSISQALPLVPQQRNLILSLARVGNVRPMDDDFRIRRRDAQTQSRLAANGQRECETRIQQLEKELQALQPNQSIIGLQGEIEELFQERGAREKADRDSIDLQRVIKNLDRKIQDLLRELGISLQDVSEIEPVIEQAVDRMKVGDALRSRVNELAGKYERVTQQREDAENQLKTLQRKLQDVDQELGEFGKLHDPTSLSSVLDEVGSPITLLNSHSEQQELCKRIERQANELLNQLDGFDGELQDAANLTVPSNHQIDQLTESISQANQEVSERRNQLAELHSERDRIREESKRNSDAKPLPTAEDLHEARAKRNQTLHEIQTSEGDTASLLGQLSDQIHTSDRIVDTIREHHQEFHSQELCRRRLQEFEHKIAAAESHVERAVQIYQDTTEDWRSAWEECGVQATTPRAMISWVARLEKLKSTTTQLEQEQERLNQIDARISRATKRIRSALDSVTAQTTGTKASATYTQNDLFDSDPQGNLDSLYDEAVAIRADSQARQQRYDSLVRRRDEIQEELPSAQTRFEARKREHDLWQEDLGSNHSSDCQG